MSKGHSAIVQTGREISIEELNHIREVVNGFGNPDDLEPTATARSVGQSCKQGGSHEQAIAPPEQGRDQTEASLPKETAA